MRMECRRCDIARRQSGEQRAVRGRRSSVPFRACARASASREEVARSNALLRGDCARPDRNQLQTSPPAPSAQEPRAPPWLPRRTTSAKLTAQTVPRGIIHLDTLAMRKLGQSFVKHATKLHFGNPRLCIDVIGSQNRLRKRHGKTLAQSALGSKCSLLRNSARLRRDDVSVHQRRESSSRLTAPLCQAFAFSGR